MRLIGALVSAALLGAASASAATTANEALESAISALREAVATSTCADPPTATCQRTVASALGDLDRALAELNPAPPPPNATPPRDARLAERALVRAGSAVNRLEKAALASGAIGEAIQALVDAAAQRVEDSEEAVENALEALCASRRIADTRRLASPHRHLDRVEDATTRALKLQRLRSALSGFDAAERAAVASLARCRPRACTASLPLGFTPGDPANESIELIPADKGTVLDFDLLLFDLQDGDLDSGELRVTYQSLASFGIRGRLEMQIEGTTATLDVTGSTKLGACTDAQGWMRMSSLTERVKLRRPDLNRSLSIATSLLSKPPTPTISGDLTLFPVSPGALRLRVGDRVEQSGVQLSAKISGEPSAKASCSVVHQVAAIEDVVVGAETLDAARIESTIACTDPQTGEVLSETITSWISSRIGEVRAEIRSDEFQIDLLLRCYEEPGTSSAGRCGPL